MSHLPRLTHTPQRHPQCCLPLTLNLISLLAHVIRPSSPPALRDIQHDPPIPCRTIVLSIGSGSGVLEAYLIDAFQPESDIYKAIHEGSGQPELGYDVSALEIYGVEVPNGHGQMNEYLPQDRRVTVRGTWDMLGPERLLEILANNAGSACPEQHDSDTAEQTDPTAPIELHLIFIYPRSPDLVGKYLQAYLQPKSSTSSGDDATLHQPQARADSSKQYKRIHSQQRLQLKSVIWAGPSGDWADYRHLFDDARAGDALIGVDVDVRHGDEDATDGVAAGETVVNMSYTPT